MYRLAFGLSSQRILIWSFESLYNHPYLVFFQQYLTFFSTNIWLLQAVPTFELSWSKAESHTNAPTFGNQWSDDVGWWCLVYNCGLLHHQLGSRFWLRMGTNWCSWMVLVPRETVFVIMRNFPTRQVTRVTALRTIRSSKSLLHPWRQCGLYMRSVPRRLL